VGVLPVLLITAQHLPQQLTLVVAEVELAFQEVAAAQAVQAALVLSLLNAIKGKS
jgi:hypothetical protein